jgi:hypothetical protein
MEIAGEDNIKNFIKGYFDCWPILGDTCNETDFDPIKTQIISRGLGISQIVNVFVAYNPKDPKYSILRVL